MYIICQECTTSRVQLDAALVSRFAEAKARLSELVDQAAKGRGVIIAKSGIPLAKLVPLDDVKRKPFKFGTLKGVLTDEVVAVIEAPLPDDVLDAMLNAPLDAGDRT
jgi:prevent-host-death family protein